MKSYYPYLCSSHSEIDETRLNTVVIIITAINCAKVVRYTFLTKTIG
jgi:hypothetical protein